MPGKPGAPDRRTSPYASVRGLTRGLDVLKALNRMESGRGTAQQLSELTGLHRTTVRRLLETLIAEGFVRRSESDDSYRLTLQVRALSEGFNDDEWISTIAAPLMGELLQRVLWPSDLTTPDGDAMIIRETTHRFSSLSFHRAMVGRRLPMLSTAAGRAYFAFCGEGEREDILNLLRSGGGGDEQAALANNAAYVRKLVARVREDGFGSNRGDWLEQRKIGAVAVPIRHADRVRGSLNVVYLARALSEQEAVKRFVAPLQDIASRVQEAMASPASARRAN
ncbi:DNA-binding transcriptional regulator [Cupriavidus basilensis]|uniref:DNA-binding transcriptional regulator n=1 Tax=Cupriavidus basilensis TaxID=68895 RepID=UPI0020A6CD2F|nr:DNA-binding transcriptional regulator [Cupriavidus basilensis]MCP3020104.1 DNA-binding transcriptional regulator [Cupriavidus basilensis]MDR3380371.1 DNA-binding transcriptional regulator [Cupriavidus basilensis]